MDTSSKDDQTILLATEQNSIAVSNTTSDDTGVAVPTRMETTTVEEIDPATFIQTPAPGILSPVDIAGLEIDPETFVERNR